MVHQGGLARSKEPREDRNRHFVFGSHGFYFYLLVVAIMITVVNRKLLLAPPFLIHWAWLVVWISIIIAWIVGKIQIERG